MWQIWLIIAGLFFVAEMITVGFLVFWLGVGALFAMVVSFFTSNLIEHRSCDNYTPMIEGDTAVNVFYIVIGKHEESGVVYYDCISTKFEQAKFNESDAKAYLRLGIISGGARLGADDKIELASLEYEKAEETKPTEKKGAVEKKK